jgi:hypothetical protein
MCFTDNPAPTYTAFLCDTLHIFLVKVAGIRGGLWWPLCVFGIVTLCDAIDRRRNIIFNRKRDSFQTLTQEVHTIVSNLKYHLFHVVPPNVLSPSQNKSTSRVILSHTYLSLTRFIEKSTNIYDTKLVSLDTS